MELLPLVNQTAQPYSAKLRVNEAATRATLIDPILTGLGWILSNPDMIEFEKVYGKTRLDYALLDCSGNVVTIIEAKALGGDLNSPAATAQILSNGFTYSLPNVILTDGIIWHHYSHAIPGSMTPASLDLSKDSLVVCADFFHQKLDAYRFWSQPGPSVIIAVGTPNPSSVPPLSNPGPTSLFQPLNTLPKDLHNLTTPKALCLPDGSVVAIKYWRDILAECVTFVLQANLSIPVPLLDKAGKRNFLLTPVKGNKKVTTMQLTYNGKPIYTYLNYDSNNIVANTIYILGFLPNGKAWQLVKVAF